MARTEFRIVHWNGSTMRINGKEFFENLDVGNLIRKDRKKRPGSITFIAHVLPGLIAIKRDDQPLVFERHHGTSREKILKQFLNLGYEADRAERMAQIVADALLSKVYRQGNVWAMYINHLIRWGESKERELEVRFRNNEPRIAMDPVIPSDPLTAMTIW